MKNGPLFIFKSIGPIWLVQEETLEEGSSSTSRRSSIHVIDGISIDDTAEEEIHLHHPHLPSLSSSPSSTSSPSSSSTSPSSIIKKIANPEYFSNRLNRLITNNSTCTQCNIRDILQSVNKDVEKNDRSSHNTTNTFLISRAFSENAAKTTTTNTTTTITTTPTTTATATISNNSANQTTPTNDLLNQVLNSTMNQAILPNQINLNITSNQPSSSLKSNNSRKKHSQRRRSSSSSMNSITPSITTTSSSSYALNIPPTGTPEKLERTNNNNKRHKKKYKLLILWPLPIITRYIILISLLVSLLNWTGGITLKCSAPSFVIYRFEFMNLLLSPFLFSFSLPNVLLAACNLLTLGLFEESLTSMLGGPKIFLSCLLSLMFGVCFLRQIIGFVFSRSTGWAVPVLFFSESLHECNQGLAPFLFALLVLQSHSLDDKYILYYGDKRHTKIPLRKIKLQLFMCMLNYTQQNILWWSLTGLITGLFGALILHITQSLSSSSSSSSLSASATTTTSSLSPLSSLSTITTTTSKITKLLPKHNLNYCYYNNLNNLNNNNYNNHNNYSNYNNYSSYNNYYNNYNNYNNYNHYSSYNNYNNNLNHNNNYIIFGGTLRRTLKRIILGFKKCSWVFLVTLLFLLIGNFCYTRPHFVEEATLIKALPADRFVLSFLVMTAPRRGDPDFLLRTIDSYLSNFPDKPEMNSFYTRTQLIIYTHFSNHTMFDKAREIYANNFKAQNYLRFHREEGSEINQRLHVSKALRLVAETFQTTYVALVEDDFPLCENKWQEFLTILFKAVVQVPEHCGIFIGTGGSGLLMKKNKAIVASDLLLQDKDTPPDNILQNCLMGKSKGCEECSQTLITSKTLLMYHLGYNTSTSPDRTYLKKDFQCGWRHPFNGDPNVITI